MYFNPNCFTFGRDITFIYSTMETKKIAIEAEGKLRRGVVKAM